MTVQRVEKAVDKEGKVNLNVKSAKELLKAIKDNLIEILERRAEEPLIIRFVKHKLTKMYLHLINYITAITEPTTTLNERALITRGPLISIWT